MSLSCSTPYWQQSITALYQCSSSSTSSPSWSSTVLPWIWWRSARPLTACCVSGRICLVWRSYWFCSSSHEWSWNSRPDQQKVQQSSKINERHNPRAHLTSIDSYSPVLQHFCVLLARNPNLHSVWLKKRADVVRVPGNWGSDCTLPVLLHNDSILWQLLLNQNDFLLTFYNEVTPCEEIKQWSI